MYEYVQIFIISNGTHTKYYSNATRNSHIKKMGESAKQKSKKTSNSFLIVFKGTKVDRM